MGVDIFGLLTLGGVVTMLRFVFVVSLAWVCVLRDCKCIGLGEGCL